MSANFTTIQTAHEDGVMTITLNRPDAMNAFNDAMSVELGAALRTAQREDSVRCIVLTGSGRAFCSGQDLQEIRGRYAEGAQPLDFAAHLRQKYNPLIIRLRTMEKPIVAALNGVAAGAGASFALACDLRIAAKSASLVMAFVNVGLVPDSAAVLTLCQHVGYAKAAELCYLSEKISADDLLAAGLVSRIVDDAELEVATSQIAARLAALPPRALGLTKRMLNRAWNVELEEQLEYEAFMQSTAGSSADHREGVAAFIEKRKPKFAGR